MKKYKIHKRRKNKNTQLIIIIFAISMFFVSYGYSAFADTLKITGTANIKYEQAIVQDVSEIYEPMVESSNYSNCTYTYENVSNWEQGDGTYIYEINLSITNLDKDYNNGNLEISFDEKQGMAEEQSKENLGILQAEKVLMTGNKITVVLTEINSQVKYGEKIDITAYITYKDKQEEGITIENVTLNGNKLSKEEPKDDAVENLEDSNIEQTLENITDEKIKQDNNIKEDKENMINNIISAEQTKESIVNEENNSIEDSKELNK